MPASITSIGMYAFSKCNSLKEVYIESTENISIGMESFDLSQDSTIYVKNENIKNILIEAGAYNSTKTTIELY